VNPLPGFFLAQAAYHYVPFYGPLPLWSKWGWPWLLLPLVIGVSVVYKALRVPTMRDLPRAAAGITAWIILGMIAAAAALVLIVKVLQRV
jgi:hypothetical protein